MYASRVFSQTRVQALLGSGSGEAREIEGGRDSQEALEEEHMRICM